jgi:hypothetical protein
MPLSDDGVNVHYILGSLQFESGMSLRRGTWGEGKLDPAGQYIEPIEIDAVAQLCSAGTAPAAVGARSNCEAVR